MPTVGDLSSRKKEPLPLVRERSDRATGAVAELCGLGKYEIADAEPPNRTFLKAERLAIGLFVRIVVAPV
jgi:hypothetical protein